MSIAGLQDNYPLVMGIIPARGGSKRLPNKNTKNLCGRPLIDYVIKVGQKCQRIDQLIVSTDSIAIKKVALGSGAKVPFLRPQEISQDHSSTEDAVKHAVLFMEKKLKKTVEIVVILQPTSPFTTPEMIEVCVDLLIEEKMDTVITVQEAEKRCEWIGLMNSRKEFIHIISKEQSTKLTGQKEYVPSGNVCAFRRDVVFEQERIIGENTGAVLVSLENSVDIDYPLDFAFAEFLLEKQYVNA